MTAEGPPRPAYEGKMLFFTQREGALRLSAHLMTLSGRGKKQECGDHHEIIAADNESIVLTTRDCWVLYYN